MAPTAAPLVAKDASIPELAAAANACRACPIGEKATQVVFGEGPMHADVLFVGEQPGDQEDKSGHPFVGPAGKVFDRALDEAGIDRARTYVTNAVKHFKWEPRGKRRIHAKPIASEIRACKPWLEAEIDRVKPRAVCMLGATAAQSLLGSAFRVTEHRGERIESDLAPIVMATVHPSSILRARDEEERGRAMERLVADLKARWPRRPRGGPIVSDDGPRERVLVRAASLDEPVVRSPHRGAQPRARRALPPRRAPITFWLDASELEGDRGALLVAYDAEAPLGCGAIRCLDAETAEVKRMYVVDAARGRGVGRLLLEALEASARRLGRTRLVLETGDRQHEAVGLYTRAGFTKTAPWGEYIDSPLSLCMEEAPPARLEPQALAAKSFAKQPGRSSFVSASFRRWNSAIVA